MHIRSIALAVSLLGCPPSIWAATGNVDIYGIVNTALPTYETYSSAADLTSGLLDPLYTPQVSVANNTSELATISSNSHTVFSQTVLGSNHVYAKQKETFSSSIYGAYGSSVWYDQVTITGGTGNGTAHFNVQINGIVDVGAFAGAVAVFLSASNLHPTQGVSPIAQWGLLASPYTDFSSSNSLVQTLAPGAAQSINITLSGAFNFTYGEAFYLLGSSQSIIADLAFLSPSCALGCLPTAPVDGTGTTTLDFANSANLVSIVLPQGATASFASGEIYNVTAVPEPAEYLMLLAGLGLVGWRVRRRS